MSTVTHLIFFDQSCHATRLKKAQKNRKKDENSLCKARAYLKSGSSRSKGIDFCAPKEK